MKNKLSERTAARKKMEKAAAKLDFGHFSETEGPDFASLLFSQPEFLNITLKTRRLRSRVAENKELTGPAIWPL